MSKKVLVTLTGSTCSGKSFLLNFLNQTQDFKKTPTFTTRPPRAGEQKDIDYFFVDDDQIKQIQGREGFVELIQYGKYYYGMSKLYLDTILNEEKTPVIICTPEGVESYEKYCKENNILLVKGYVWVEEEIRLSRFMNRIVESIKEDASDENVKKTVFENINRCRNMYIIEQNWFGMNKWDVIISGNSPDTARNMLLKKINMMQETVI